MPWGNNKTGEGLCDLVGKQRLLARQDVVQYRSWTWPRFMMTITPSVFKMVWPWALGHAIIAVTFFMIHEHVHKIHMPNNGLLKVFTAPTSFLLLFRCNMGYQRFWEGRGHFGQFNFALREVTRRCYTFILGADEHDSAAATVRHNVIRLLMVMAISVRTDLRFREMGEDASEE